MQSIHDYYEQLAPTYDRDRFGNSYGRYVDAMERGVLKEWLRKYDASKVVDLACGTGRLLEYAMTGVDISAAMLAEARTKWPDRRLIRADAAMTDLPADSFDAAICFHLFMHLDEAACIAILAEGARIVRSGGSFIFDIPSRPRRTLSRRPASGWHGDTSASIADVRRWAGDEWHLRRHRGLLFFPIHRIPSRMRTPLSRLDGLIGRTPLARWSSYYICELVRR